MLKLVAALTWALFFTPATTIPAPGLAHTNHLISLETPAVTVGPSGFHPADLRAAYGDTAQGQAAIAIVDAYDYPAALNDFNVFSAQFGLPQGNLSVVYENGKKPAPNPGWNQEAALDIEWAHAMAPSAKIYLVEAASNGIGDLCYSAEIASQLPGVTQVSMSWGMSEVSYEADFDSFFRSGAATYFASAGDTGAVPEWPSTSPDVVGVGGTTLTLEGGEYGSETPWTSAGGGVSLYEPSPAWQAGLGYSKRAAPDICAVANPSTGVAVYDSVSDGAHVGWMVFGGTSVACPVCAGLANAGAAHRATSETAWIYGVAGLFHDITTGGTGPIINGIYKDPAKVGYDLATGWGSPRSAASL
jgi:kumamolisin